MTKKSNPVFAFCLIMTVIPSLWFAACASGGGGSADRNLFNLPALLREWETANKENENMEMFLQLGHMQTITSAALSPDGKYAISGSEDKTIKLWDAATG